jgi:hypothetical protein
MNPNNQQNKSNPRAERAGKSRPKYEQVITLARNLTTYWPMFKPAIENIVSQIQQTTSDVEFKRKMSDLLGLVQIIIVHCTGMRAQAPRKFKLRKILHLSARSDQCELVMVSNVNLRII